MALKLVNLLAALSLMVFGSVVAFGAGQYRYAEYVDLGEPKGGTVVSPNQAIFYDPVNQRNIIFGEVFSLAGGAQWVIDIDTGKLLLYQELPSRQTVHQAYVQDKDGNVYFCMSANRAVAGVNNVYMFDPRVGKIINLGSVPVPHTRPWVILLMDNKLYVGSHGDRPTLSVYSLKEGRWLFSKEFPPPDSRVYSLARGPKGRLLVTVFPANYVAIVDPETGEVLDKVEALEGIGTYDIVVEGNTVFLPKDGNTVVFNDDWEEVAVLEGITVQRINDQPEGDGLGNVFGWRGKDLVRIDAKTLEITTIRENCEFTGWIALTNAVRPFRSSVDYNIKVIYNRVIQKSYPYKAELNVLDINASKSSTFAYEIKGKAPSGQYFLAKGPDGNLYGLNHTWEVWRYNVATGEFEHLGPSDPKTEWYHFVSYKDKVFAGGYGGAWEYLYDPFKPWNPGREPGSNPIALGQLGKDQNRPFDAVIGPTEKVWIVSRSKYGVSGGAVTWFKADLDNIKEAFDNRTVYRDPPFDMESGQCVTTDGRYIFVGTNIQGGRGGPVDMTRQGKIVVFDPYTEEKLLEIVPVEGNYAVMDMEYNPKNGLIYGVVKMRWRAWEVTKPNGYIFIFDPKTMAVIDTIGPLRSPSTNIFGLPEEPGWYDLEVGQDGDVYGITVKDFFKIDTSTNTLIYLKEPPLAVLNHLVEGEAPGIWYMGAGSHILKYLPEGTFWCG